jgi:hypothetical protein
LCVPAAAEDAAVLGWHVQQAGLTAAALRAFEAERIPRVKEVFGMGDRHAAKMKEGARACVGFSFEPDRSQCLCCSVQCSEGQRAAGDSPAYCAACLCPCTALAGIPQRDLLQERAELLYGKAKFKPLKQLDGKAAPVAAAVPAGAASA